MKHEITSVSSLIGTEIYCIIGSLLGLVVGVHKEHIKGAQGPKQRSLECFQRNENKYF